MKVKIYGTRRNKNEIFKQLISEEIEVNNFEEILLFAKNNEFTFNRFKIMNEEVKIENVPLHEDLTGRFVTIDGTNFYIVTDMIVGKELAQLNINTKKFDYDKGIAVNLSNHTWDRISKLKKATFDTFIPEKETSYYLPFTIFKDNIDKYEVELLRRITASFTGHRPEELGGYDMKNSTMLELKEKLLILIENLINKKGIIRFISGGALGADQAAFWCVHILKKKYPHIKNIIAVPFRNQPIKWSNEQKHWYYKMLSLADEVIFVDELTVYNRDEKKQTGEYSGYKMQIRNEYMVDNSDIIIAIFDGKLLDTSGKIRKSGTLNCIKYAIELDRFIYRLDSLNHFTLSENYKLKDYY